MCLDLTFRLTEFCQGLTDDGYAPHGVAIIIPTSDEDADLLQEYGNNPAKLRALIERANDPEHVLHLRAELANARGTIEAHETYIRELQAECAGAVHELQNALGTISELRDGLNGAMDVADRRGAQIATLRADLEHADEVLGSEHATAVRLSDDLAMMRQALLDSSTARSAQSELRAIAEANYASCQESVGILVAELHRVGGLLRTAEYRLATFGYRPQ